jgi:diguanylate cyclase (GGDEF)-like protein
VTKHTQIAHTYYFKEVSTEDFDKKLNECLTAVLHGETESAGSFVFDGKTLKHEETIIAEQISLLMRYLKEFQQFSTALCEGNITSAFQPSKNNPFTGQLKLLQSKMQHLSWQAEEIGKGDYTQTLIDLGDFSKSFNNVIQAVNARETRLVQSFKILSTIIDSTPTAILVMRGVELLYEDKSAQVLRQFLSKNCGNDLFAAVAKISEEAYGSDYRLNLSIKEYRIANTDVYYEIQPYIIEWTNKQNAVLFSISDITERKRVELQLVKDAEYDVLTGIGNRKHGIRALSAALKQKTFPLALIFADLDGLKKINDNFGHRAGDTYINSFVKGVTKYLTRSSLMTRLGGDEFLIMMRRTTKQQATELLDTIALDFRAGKTEHPPEFSAGVIEITGDSVGDAEEFIAQADTIMYESKQRKYSAKAHFHAKNSDPRLW